MRIRIGLAFFVAVGVVGIPMSATADELDTRFAKISVGETRDGVIAIMEQRPNTETNSTTLGVASAKMIWKSSDRLLVVITLLDRVVRTKSCDPDREC